MTWFASVKAEIDALHREDGWLDGEGSAVTDVARFVAAAWAHALAERFWNASPIHARLLACVGIGQEPRVFPSESGGVSLEWLWVVDRGDALRVCAWLMSLEVLPDGAVSLYEDVSGRIEERRAPSFDLLVAALSRLADEARIVGWMRSDPLPDTSILAYRPKGNPPNA